MGMSGRIALITGAAQGIGAATACRLAQAGARVILADVDVDKGEALARELGPSHRFVRLDVSDEGGWAALAEEIAGREGGLDIAFLNAGVIARPNRSTFELTGLEWMRADVLQRVFSINTFGVAYGLIHCFPLVRARGGVIVATGSTAGIDVFEADPIYSASKSAVIALVRALAREYDAAGVRLCAVNPGSVDTQIYPTNFRAARAEAGTLASPDFLAEAVLHVIEQGEAGDVWMARPEDRGFWVYQPRALPRIAAGEQVPGDGRFVACTTGIIQEPAA